MTQSTANANGHTQGPINFLVFGPTFYQFFGLGPDLWTEKVEKDRDWDRESRERPRLGPKRPTFFGPKTGTETEKLEKSRSEDRQNFSVSMYKH